MKIILLGAPGSGKGTHSKKLTNQFHIPQISTGDIFRKNLKDETPLGLKIKDILAHGLLVPDDITIAIIEDRLKADDCKEGYILDGFPRTIAQAQAFDKVENVDCAILISVDNEEIISRLSGRRYCNHCHGIFQAALLKSNFCENCGDELVIRQDDKIETVTKRLEIYEQNTAPLIEYFEQQGKLRRVDGQGSIDEVYSRILEALKA